jgi:hypothetical protein
MADYAVVSAAGTAVGLSLLGEKAKSSFGRLIKGQLPLALACALLLYISWRIPTDDNFYVSKVNYYRHFGRGIDTTYFSRGAIEFLKSNNISGRPFHQLEIGGLLLWERPGEKNFIDSRNLSDELGEEYFSILRMEEGYERRIDGYGIDYMVFHPTDMLSDPRVMPQTLIAYCATRPDTWKLVYWDDKSMIYLKNETKFLPVIQKYEYTVLQPYLVFHKTAEFTSRRQREPEAFRRELQRKLAEEPAGVLVGEISRFAR